MNIQLTRVGMGQAFYYAPYPFMGPAAGPAYQAYDVAGPTLVSPVPQVVPGPVLVPAQDPMGGLLVPLLILGGIVLVATVL